MLQYVNQILESLDRDKPNLPATVLYNEGWLLRLVLAAMQRLDVEQPFRFQPDARWFSEALLTSPFLARARARSNRLSEKHTHADGVVGQFEIRKPTRTGLTLVNDTTQFIVCEAKMFSLLRESVGNAPEYDQAARTVACMAETVSQLFKPDGVEKIDVGFYVLAPRQQIEARLFDDAVNEQSIEHKIDSRIEAYREVDPQRYTELIGWKDAYLTPLLRRLVPRCVPWEELIESVRQKESQFGQDLRLFYERCLKENRPPSPPWT